MRHNNSQRQANQPTKKTTSDQSISHFPQRNHRPIASGLQSAHESNTENIMIFPLVCVCVARRRRQLSMVAYKYILRGGKSVWRRLRSVRLSERGGKSSAHMTRDVTR